MQRVDDTRYPCVVTIATASPEVLPMVKPMTRPAFTGNPDAKGMTLLSPIAICPTLSAPRRLVHGEPDVAADTLTAAVPAVTDSTYTVIEVTTSALPAGTGDDTVEQMPALSKPVKVSV